MALYKVSVAFEDEYEIEADSESEAIDEALDLARSVGEWDTNAELLTEEEDDDA